MAYSGCYLILIFYWLIFYHKILLNPYLLAYGEALDCEFPTQRLCGEYWRKFKIPKDPYYFKNLIGVRAGTLYPFNILASYLASFFKLDHAWIIHVWNILLHNLATPIFAFHLFGGGLIGLFGALAWGYCGYHIKSNLWYVQAFTWITATLCFATSPVLSGICLAMLILSGTPPLVGYFILCSLLTFKLSPLALLYGLIISSPQIIAYLRYFPKSIRSWHGVEDKRRIGKLQPWIYLTTFLPVKIRNYLFDVGYWEFAFYLTPIVVFFALFGNPLGWVFVLTCILLSYGGTVFKLSSRIMFRGPQRWGYFACLGIIYLCMEGLVKFNLPNKNLILLTILLGTLLLYNRHLLPIYPFAQWTKKPSYFFETSLLRFLEENANGGRVNNLPYPVYSGQINHIKGLGYCGGNSLKSARLGRNFNSIQGCCGNNWFEYSRENGWFDDWKIKYHVGNKPCDHSMWRKVKGFNLYENISYRPSV